MHEFLLENKTAIITGGGNGIGKQTALLFAKHKANIIIVDINGLSGEETVELIHEEGGKAIFINANISKPADCQNMIETAEKSFGGLNILFNNAGIMHHLDGNVTDIDEKTWDMTMSINAKGTFLSCKYAIPSMIRSGGGSIINASSFVALRGSENSNIAYSASKAAIIALSQDLSATYAKNKIRTNTLCPGPTLTESFQRYLADEPNREENYLETIPMKHFAKMDDIAKAALFLASDESSYMTGSSLIVDGGITASFAI